MLAFFPTSTGPEAAYSYNCIASFLDEHCHAKVVCTSTLDTKVSLSKEENKNKLKKKKLPAYERKKKFPLETLF